MAGVSTTIAAVATAFRVLYWWRQQCNQISNGCLEIFKKIITLPSVTILFLFTFFNLILDAPHTYQIKIRQKLVFTLQIGDNFFLNLNSNRGLTVKPGWFLPDFVQHFVTFLYKKIRQSEHFQVTTVTFLEAVDENKMEFWDTTQKTFFDFFAFCKRLELKIANCAYMTFNKIKKFRKYSTRVWTNAEFDADLKKAAIKFI